MDVKSKLTPHQLEVFEEITSKIKDNLSKRVNSIPLSDRFLSLTGAAGTGKSYLTAAIVDEIDNTLPVGQYDIQITAPTHKALKVMKEMLFYSYDIGVNCSTIHSFLNIKQNYDYETGAEIFTVDRGKDINKASLLIVDESSMVSNELFDFILEILKKGYVNTVLFIGDKFQLLPVNESSNNVFRLKNQFKLTKIVRQAKNSAIIELATKIRVCIANEEYEDLRDILENTPNSEDIQFFESKKEFLEDFCKNENWHEEDKIVTSFRNNDVDSFNNILRRKYWQEQGINNPQYLISNDKIRFKKPSFDLYSDDYQKVIFQNGEEIIIDKAELIFDEELKIYYWECLGVDRSPFTFFRVIDPNSMTKFNNILNDYAYFAKIRDFPLNMEWWNKYFKLRDSFSDIQYSFASTIHKLQGSTYETAYIDLASLLNNRQISRDFLYRLVYVAITRAKKSVKILY